MRRRLSESIRRLLRRSPRPAAPTVPSAPSADISDAALADVVVEYRPTRDGDPDPGEVVWTWVPWEEDPTQGKDRPVVVFGRHGDRLAAVALTSKPHHDDDHVLVGTGPWDGSGRPSYAKLDRILDVDPDQVRREGGALDPERFAALVDALGRHANVIVRGAGDR